MSTEAPVRAGEQARRDEVRIGIGLSSMGFVLAGLGACIAILARDLDEPTDRLALLSSGFALGLLIVAVVGPRILRTWPMTTVLAIGSVVCAFGTVLLALAPVYAVAIAGGLCVGLGGALLVLVAPLMLDGPTAAARLSRVNAVASGTGILAPLAIGALDSLGPTGRLAMLAAAPPLVALAVLSRRAQRPHPPGRPVDTPVPVLIDSAPAVGLGRRWLGRKVALDVGLGWLRVVLAVAVEFCFVVWAVARLVDSGLSTATAAVLGSAFPIGMAVGRAIGPIRWRGWSPVVPSGLLAILGTLLVSLFDAPAAVALGLAIAGLGVAPLYPVTLAALVATPGLSPARLSAIGALASGTAILIAPAALAGLARVVDLRTAYLVTLPLLITLFVLSRRPARATAAS
ncbi:MFS transporter [Kribbella pittospori]|uniref:MFS transporter n=1 Tax=Kribbella pittospori TaxID=722689 RepID=A0A4R0L082_9ACTN|nr:MFS transporter [Kribbella pittospori]TCC61925.1 MFS transporter [Kribbella pittospori]